MGKKLLITEDCDEFGEENVFVLRNSGFDLIFSAKNGIRVIDAIEKQKPVAVILDLFMPELDAIGVIRSIKQRANVVNVPIFIVLSSFDNSVLEKEAISAGASYFAIKPFNIHDLADRISSLTSFADKESFSAYPTNNTSFNAPTKNVLSNPSFNNQSMEMRVTEILHQIGVPAHIKGYQYLRESIIVSVETPAIINAVTKELYPTVAKEFSTTPSRVERAIRHAIEVAWDRGDIDVLNSYFGFTIHGGRGKPTNSEFIAMISDKLRLQVENNANNSNQALA
ncbi:MAG: sporulation transcription factor Spo0A [Oscillospiraceae bacterium]|jgi:two-component system response regulator (stage 0 sporulation protein A)|nr:sporulation transcription factor Spo0A [Oscillospiraceae bacterium]